MLHYLGSIFLFAILISSCHDDVDLLEEVTRKKGNEEVVENFTLHYTDSGRLKVVMKAPVVKRSGNGNNNVQEFTDGIYCEFYDDSSHLTATLTARYAFREEYKRIMTARDHVKLIKADGSTLESEELIWDENRQLIYSNKFFKYTRGKEVGTGFFFEADQSFKRIKMQKTEADNIVLPGLDTK
ncbi:MAG: LPS export ABC transporter periplasmic protein LptC [Saprospiraceae bacterium]